MKKILFVLSVLASLVMVVGCSNPTNTVIIPPVVPTTEPETPATVEPEAPVTPAQPETPSQPETPATTEPEQPTEPQTPTVPEDKSSFEYVKPDCVNLADYTYVGDYIFADSMNFAEWKYSNSETGYLLAFEKIARVKNDNISTQILRCWHDTLVDFNVVKATKYKIYVKTSVISAAANNEVIINTHNKTLAETYDGTQIEITKVDNDLDIRFFDGSRNSSDYVAY